jgi:hypothetical protein
VNHAQVGKWSLFSSSTARPENRQPNLRLPEPLEKKEVRPSRASEGNEMPPFKNSENMDMDNFD